ncbi:MAG TPA: ornithine carbamoyltransferase, partial [Candidatus Dormibacteraeota bacterium]|nr:ornithine carbamoyltransferase [Candidatus Dormibacteraeota bacterium]
MIAAVDSLAGHDFIDLADLQPAQLRRILDLGHAIKAGRWRERPLEGRHIAMLFQRPSHRTRVSFEVGIARLGGSLTTLSGQDVQLGFRESVGDAARVLDRYVDGIVARLRSHGDLLQLANASEKTVINALTDRSHPCQVLADLLTIEEVRGELTEQHVVYIGDGNNIANSLMEGAALGGFLLTVISPPGYQPEAAA